MTARTPIRTPIKAPIGRGPQAMPQKFVKAPWKEYKKTHQWPTSDEMRNAPVVQLFTVVSEPSKRAAVKSELIAGIRAVRGQPGVKRSALYELVEGTENAPEHLVVLLADKPSSLQRLENQFKDREQRLKNLGAKSVEAPAVSRTLVGRVGE